VIGGSVVGFVVFSLRRGVRGLVRNGVMTLAAVLTMVLMLLLVSGLVIVLTGLDAGLRFVEQRVEVVGYLDDGARPAEVASLRRAITAVPGVASVTLVSKEEALARYREELRREGREDLLDVLGFNPLPASLQVKLSDPAASDEVVRRLEAEPAFVNDVQETAKVADAITSLSTVLRNAGLVAMVLVGGIALIVVVNAIRTAVLARRDEIEIMRLVGASDRFIRWPFVIEGLLVGGAAALVTLALLSLAAGPLGGVASAIVAQLPLGFDPALAVRVTSLVVGAGLAVGGLGAWISVRAHLGRSGT
jgi:cell division transport system permease protein